MAISIWPGAFTGKDFILIDFEGDISHPLSSRRLKRSPLRDVAGMLRFV
jgi:maltose alpha-D-glucosyltransferase/alpha-amylase